jgi:ubiquinol-cytochrome c reductase cytochrome c subunit
MQRSVTTRSAAAARGAVAGWALLAALAGLLLVSGSGGAGAQEDAGEDAADSFRRGETLYSVNCAGCHGGDGRGGETVGGLPAPPLAGVDRVTVAYMRMVMDTGRMPPAGDPRDNRIRRVALTVQERDDILRWTTETFDLDGDVEEPPHGDVADGLRVYAANCASCHGASGAGGVAGGGAWTPRVNDVSAQTIADAVRTGPFQMPRFDAEQITEEELGSIAAFLEEVQEEGGTLLFPGELNPVFASGFGAGLAAVIVLALMAVAGRPQMFPNRAPDERDPAVSDEPPPRYRATDEVYGMRKEDRNDPVRKEDRDDRNP